MSDFIAIDTNIRDSSENKFQAEKNQSKQKMFNFIFILIVVSVISITLIVLIIVYVVVTKNLANSSFKDILSSLSLTSISSERTVPNKNSRFSAKTDKENTNFSPENNLKKSVGFNKDKFIYEIPNRYSTEYKEEYENDIDPSPSPELISPNIKFSPVPQNNIKQYNQTNNKRININKSRQWQNVLLNNQRF